MSGQISCEKSFKADSSNLKLRSMNLASETKRCLLSEPFCPHISLLAKWEAVKKTLAQLSLPFYNFKPDSEDKEDVHI